MLDLKRYHQVKIPVVSANYTMTMKLVEKQVVSIFYYVFQRANDRIPTQLFALFI